MYIIITCVLSDMNFIPLTTDSLHELFIIMSTLKVFGPIHPSQEDIYAQAVMRAP